MRVQCFSAAVGRSRRSILITIITISLGAIECYWNIHYTQRYPTGRPTQPRRCDLLWSDPDDRCGWGISPRGARFESSWKHAWTRLDPVIFCGLIGNSWALGIYWIYVLCREGMGLSENRLLQWSNRYIYIWLYIIISPLKYTTMFEVSPVFRQIYNIARRTSREPTWLVSVTWVDCSSFLSKGQWSSWVLSNFFSWVTEKRHQTA